MTLALASPEQVFVDAKQAYAALKADKARRVQRTPYEKLIKQLSSAAKAKGDKADDCAYFAATVAEELHQASGVAADLDQAIELNVAVADGFSKSTLADDALWRAARLLMTRRGDLDGARTLLQRARKDYPNGDQVRAVAELLGRIPPEAPRKAEKPAEKTTTDKTEKSAKVDRKPAPPEPRTHVDKSDKPAAMEEDTASKDKLQEILNRFAESQKDTGLPVTMDVAASPSSVQDEHDHGNAEEPVAPAPGQAAAALKGVTLDQKGEATVVGLGVDGPVAIRSGVAPAQGNTPQRFYVDVSPVLMGGAGRALKGYKDSRVVAARAAQFDARTVRVVFELKANVPGVAVYDQAARKVRITLGTPPPAAPPVLPITVLTPPVPAPASEPVELSTAGVPDAGPSLDDVKSLAADLKGKPAVSLSAQAGLKVRRVVIDPGHGGDDPGAIGPTGVKEKDVTLKIAKKVAEKLRKDLKMEVILTRDKDVFIPLEERTAIANAAHADLFISIHCNSNPNRRIHGVETYYLNITDDNYAIRLAARENKTSARSISDLQFILADLAMKSNVDDSVRLSKMVQANVVGELRDNYQEVKDLGVKHALFYVLIGAKMPAILLESSFVSNKTEEARLNNPKYQDRVADGLVQGVRDFVEERQALAR